MNTTLTADVGRVLAGAGLTAASRFPAGHPDGGGYAVERMPQCGPGRAAVRWHGTGDGYAGLELCRTALATAGYLVETVHASVTYIAVLPPPGS